MLAKQTKGVSGSHRLGNFLISLHFCQQTRGKQAPVVLKKNIGKK
jgi:hypothetical protein